jgi:hypothetical protein
VLWQRRYGALPGLTRRARACGTAPLAIVPHQTRPIRREVWLATWLGSPVAVKTIVPELQSKEKLVKRFIDEILIMRCALTGPPRVQET